MSPPSRKVSFGGITSLAIDRGLDFCQLHVDIVRYAWAIGEKNSIYIIFTGNSVDLSGYCYTGGCYIMLSELFANCSFNRYKQQTNFYLNNYKIN